MKTFEYTIKDPNGLHARPAGLLVQMAQKSASTIKITRGEKSADLKRLFAVMGMNVKRGETVSVSVEGSDEADTAKALEEFFTANF